ncbi:MAG TPA: tetratricopeptide repeat protein, partial [Alphaproteobacteria bacterium]|nr:tetratricopeptide repeat protein [Alphaproteobacteria bacterium]
MRVAGIVALALAGALIAAAPTRAETVQEGFAAYSRGDYAGALRILRPLADQGRAESRHILAVMYLNGQGVPQSGGEAVRWFRAAADQGFVPSQISLGRLYEHGQAVPQDYREALR